MKEMKIESNTFLGKRNVQNFCSECENKVNLKDKGSSYDVDLKHPICQDCAYTLASLFLTRRERMAF